MLWLLEEPHELILRQVRVLKLVHQQMLNDPPVLHAQGLVLPQQEHGLHQQVAEVHGVGGQQQVLIARVDALHDHMLIGRRDVDLWRDELALGVGDLAHYVARRAPAGLHPQLAQHMLHDLELIIRIEDQIVGSPGMMLGLDAQQARADAVKGAHRGAPQPSAQQRLGAAAHLGGRAVGEGYGHDRARIHILLAHQPRQALREHPRLAAARPGVDDDGAGAGGHCRALLFVQMVQLHAVHCDRRTRYVNAE